MVSPLQLLATFLLSLSLVTFHLEADLHRLRHLAQTVELRAILALAACIPIECG